MTFVVGLTGGIGSGKSAAAADFAALGVTVVDTDVIAHELTAKGGAALAGVEKLFGPAAGSGDGPMNRAKVRELVVSTTGASPVTVTVSSRAPTRRSAFTVAVKSPDSSIPSRLTVLKPVSVNVTVYDPGRRSMMRYWPAPSVTTVRTFSMSAGLAASTVTPGNTAPDVSLTTPAMDACA